MREYDITDLCVIELTHMGLTPDNAYYAVSHAPTEVIHQIIRQSSGHFKSPLRSGPEYALSYYAAVLACGLERK